VSLPETIIELVNFLLMLATIGAGGFAFLAPRFTMRALSLTTAGTNEGLSEVRAASGGLFIAIGLVGLFFPLPAILFMVGIAYAGAATGRVLAIVLDKAGSPKIWLFFLWEVLFAAWLIAINFPGIALAS
jgi:hypothetical protein